MFLLLASSALAGVLSETPDRRCAHTTTISMAADTAHTVWKTHGVDVAGYFAEHRLGFKDHQPLEIEAGSGNWCLALGTLRPIGEAIRGNLGIAFIIDGKATLVPSTFANDLTIFGLRKDQVVQIEFVQMGPPVVRSCKRTEYTDAMDLVDGSLIPRTAYDCTVATQMTWIVTEHREYSTDPNWVPAPLPKNAGDDPLIKSLQDVFKQQAPP